MNAAYFSLFILDIMLSPTATDNNNSLLRKWKVLRLEKVFTNTDEEDGDES